jgi:uncharacterized phage infection (PIP) family protein YhgE
MASKVEIIIEATDKFKKPLDDAEKKLKKLKAEAEANKKAFRDFAGVVGAAIGTLYALDRALTAVADRAKDLGLKNVAKPVDDMHASIQMLIDELLSLNIAGKNQAEGFLKEFTRPVTEGFQTVTLAVEVARGAIELAAISIDRLIGAVAEFRGEATKSTAAWYELKKAQLIATEQAKLTEIWEGKLTENLIKQNAAVDRSAAKLQNKRKNLDDLMKAQKGLNDETNKGRQIEDAIRRGDARALADLQSQGDKAADSALTAGGGMKANRPGFEPIGRNRGDYEAGGGRRAVSADSQRTESGQSNRAPTTVNVYIGNKPVVDAVAEVFIDGVKQSKSTGSSSGRKNMGHSR